MISSETLPIALTKAICGRNSERTEAFASQWGYESTESDWKALIARDDIDAIDICTPNDSHAAIAIAAAEAGKMVLCEKPLARTTEESLPMVEAVEKAGVANTVWYNYRRIPAVTLAKQIIDSGKLGKVFHYRANFLQDWTISEELPQGGEGLWRLDAAAAGSGVTGDLLAHCIDTAIWLNGGFRMSPPSPRPSSRKGCTLPPERNRRSPSMMPVFSTATSTTDLSACLNPPAMHAVTRLYTLEIVEKMLPSDVLHDLNRLEFFDHSDEGKVRGWRSIHITVEIIPTSTNGGFQASALVTNTPLSIR